MKRFQALWGVDIIRQSLVALVIGGVLMGVVVVAAFAIDWGTVSQNIYDDSSGRAQTYNRIAAGASGATGPDGTRGSRA